MAKPGMLITGAAGFLGRRLVAAFQPEYTIFALDRRPPQTGCDPVGPGIRWLQADIAAAGELRAALQHIDAQQPIAIVLHLAGYYDFTGTAHPEYQRTNIDGTRNLLDLAAMFPLRRIVFTSSLAACPFPPPGQAITEATPPLGTEAYSHSKRAGEELLRAYQDRLPATIVRLAAAFTDWCEYEPLSHFIAIWCSRRWDARVLGGRGEWALPYIHTRDLVQFFRRVVACANRNDPLEVLQGSPNGCTTHRELYQAVTCAHYGAARPAWYVPRPIAHMGIVGREQLGRLTGRATFERAWMVNYIDRRLTIDATQTHRRLNWAPAPANAIQLRIPQMIANRNAAPDEWQRRQQNRRTGRA